MRDFIRLLTGRILYERKSRLKAAELGHAYTSDEYPAEYQTQRIYHFLMTGEYPR